MCMVKKILWLVIGSSIILEILESMLTQLSHALLQRTNHLTSGQGPQCYDDLIFGRNSKKGNLDNWTQVVSIFCNNNLSQFSKL